MSEVLSALLGWATSRPISHVMKNAHSQVSFQLAIYSLTLCSTSPSPPQVKMSTKSWVWYASSNSKSQMALVRWPLDGTADRTTWYEAGQGWSFFVVVNRCIIRWERGWVGHTEEMHKGKSCWQEKPNRWDGEWMSHGMDYRGHWGHGVEASAWLLEWRIGEFIYL